MKIFAYCLAGLLCLSNTVSAEIYGLVIGIDHYAKPIKSLQGGINDANMVAEALHSIGAKDVKLLTDQMATRENIEQAWQAIVKNAKPNDIVFFTYAGHGAQHPERVKGTEADGQDEFYVLSNFSKSGPNTKERIDDDDLQVWFSKVPQLKIVLVSDSCHSGTMTRAYRTSKTRYRSTEVGKLTRDALPIINNPTLVDERKTPLSHVLSYSGVPDNSTVPEVLIEDNPHGALSWYLSKGIMGEADVNRDQIIQTDELKIFLEAKVPQETDGQQHPEISLPTLITLVSNAIVKPDKIIDIGSIHFAITGAPPFTALVESLKSRLQNILFTAPEAALLTLDLNNQRLINKFDDTVFALAVDENKVKDQPTKTMTTNWLDISLPIIQQIIDKYLFVEKIKNLSDGSLRLNLQPNDKLHHQGEVLSLVIDNSKQPHFTLFNIASDGTLNFLYPQVQDPSKLPWDKPYRLPLEVTPPFGADHFIAIASREPLMKLHEKLQTLDGKKGDFGLFFNDIEQIINNNSYQIGIYSTYTHR